MLRSLVRLPAAGVQKALLELGGLTACVVKIGLPAPYLYSKNRFTAEAVLNRRCSDECEEP